MTKPRFCRLFGAIEKTAIVNALGECRRACLDASGAALSNDKEVKRVCDAIVAAIDDAANVLTGSREHFWAKGMSSSNGMPPFKES